MALVLLQFVFPPIFSPNFVKAVVIVVVVDHSVWRSFFRLELL